MNLTLLMTFRQRIDTTQEIDHITIWRKLGGIDGTKNAVQGQVAKSIKKMSIETGTIGFRVLNSSP